MNPILEEAVLPTTTSNPDIEPTYVEGTPISPRLDRMRYEYDDEHSVEGAWEDDGSTRSKGTRDDDAISMARTFGVKSRTGDSIRHYSSFDSSLRQNIPVPSSPVGYHRNSLPLSQSIPPIPPKSPNRTRSGSVSIDGSYTSDVSPIAGPSRLPLHHDATHLGHSAYYGDNGEDDEGSETPRSMTPASSFYAKPKRRQQAQIATRDSSLGLASGTTGDDPPSPPRAEPLNPHDNRTSDEGFDSRSNSTGSQSLRSHPPVPVDANLRSMPGVVGLGDGWAGGPQNQGKKRKLWFMRKDKAKKDEDPLALWSIQENGANGHDSKTGQKKGMFKEAWNRSISKLSSMPALVSGDHVNGNGESWGAARTSVRALLSRSRLDLSKEKKTDATVDSGVDEEEKPAKRRSVAFFGLSKSQIDVSNSKASPQQSAVQSAQQSNVQSPTYPSSIPRTLSNGMAESSRPRDLSNITPIATPSRDSRRLSAPLSAPASPGGLPPPWRPQSFIIPRPEPATPAPRPFSRHDEIEEEQIRPQGLPALSMSDDRQASGSSAGPETPMTASADGRSLNHKSSMPLTSDDEHLRQVSSPSPIGTRPTLQEISRGRSYTSTPTSSIPRDASTPGLDTLKDWAQEGKRYTPRPLRPIRSPTPRSRETSSHSQQPRSIWSSGSIFDKLKQVLAVPETPPPREAFSTSAQPVPLAGSNEMEVDKDLPDLPSRSTTPLAMPGAFPLDSTIKNAPLPASPYDITQAVAEQILATPSPSRPSSRQAPRKRGVSGDMWSRRLSKISETNNNEGSEAGSRSSSRQEKRRSYSALAGRIGFGNVRRNNSRSDQFSDIAISDPTISMLTPALEALEFGENDLGLDDILDENRRMSLVRDLEASLPLPPARNELSNPASSPPKSISTISSSEATVLAAPIKLESPTHRSHPSTSTSASRSSVDETVTTPAQMRVSLDKSITERRGSGQSDEVERTFGGQHWPTRGHRRGTSMGSIGELAHDLLHKPAAGISMAKRTSVIEDMEDEDQLRRREREERTMSFGSGISSLSSAMSLDDEEAVPMSAVRVASPQQHRPRQIELGSPSQGIRAL